MKYLVFNFVRQNVEFPHIKNQKHWIEYLLKKKNTCLVVLEISKAEGGEGEKKWTYASLLNSLNKYFWLQENKAFFPGSSYLI